MMTTKDPSVRWISNAYYWVFHFFSIFFSKFGVYTKGRAKVVGYVLERDKSPNLPRFSELSIGRVGLAKSKSPGSVYETDKHGEGQPEIF